MTTQYFIELSYFFLNIIYAAFYNRFLDLSLILVFLVYPFGLCVFSWDRTWGFIYLNFIIILIIGWTNLIFLIFIFIISWLFLLFFHLIFKSTLIIFLKKTRRVLVAYFGSCENKLPQSKLASLLFTAFYQNIIFIYIFSAYWRMVY